MPLKRKIHDALILPFFEGNRPAFDEGEFSPLFTHALESGDFKGKKGETLCLYPDWEGEKRLVLVGLGPEDLLSLETLRRSYGSAILGLKKKGTSVNVLLAQTSILQVEELSGAVVEGALLANYTFDDWKSEKDPALSEITFLGGDEEAIRRSRILCHGVSFTRDLVMNNASVVTPTFLANVAKELASEYKGVKTTVFNREQIIKENMHLLEAVACGSSEEPAFIVVEYRGNPGSNRVCGLVGKGISYDTGGLNLKPTGSMETMRDDMSGAGALLGTLHAIANLELPVNVVVCIASTENAIGPKSYKPGDSYPSHKGVTVEITNTDAEGRLVLADALSYMEKHFSPEVMIDIATLTGGAVVALGDEASCLMGNDDPLCAKLMESGQATYERLCKFPLYEEYEELLKSKVADIKNSGVRKASAIQGGIFLKRFVSKAKWAHLDIAGTAFTDNLKSYQPVQATGVGVRLLTRFLQAHFQ